MTGHVGHESDASYVSLHDLHYSHESCISQASHSRNVSQSSHAKFAYLEWYKSFDSHATL